MKTNPICAKYLARCAARESCRDLNFKTLHVALCSLIALVALAGAFAPAITFLVFALWEPSL